ncbi:Spy/CpxP family protein refolding chaperone [Aliiglaciecola sp. 3_MG-2023]|uniref:Spy/CpxP family protein refolding chaperone n=1 Tax=Aliiglaciecola sp. 3_MG-2023 TaxID=3062644 RepID=UPI0026E2640C|nr:Spy/CpxP family protein refolding chaperone [Aliiglaciecola sp. 3_MG-2023]MDO6692036.1 Spy/CpxP family protein refolding chaperone [Aliiglaciecola sp. 3_MG-2023]
MKRKLFLSKALIAMAATAAISSIAVQAHERPESPMRAVFKKLDLTDQQKLDVRTIMKQSKEDGKIYKQDLKDIKEQLKSLIRSTDWDQEAVVSLLETEQEIKAQLALGAATKRNAIWNTLTAEQQQKLSAMDEKGKNRKGKKAKGDKRRSPMKMFKRLDLTEEQSSEIKALFKAQKTTMDTQRETAKGYRQQAQEIVRSESFDQDAWLAVSQKLQAVQLEMSTEMSSVRHQIWNILNQEQQAKMAKMEEKREHRKGGDRGDKKRRHQDDEA